MSLHHAIDREGCELCDQEDAGGAQVDATTLDSLSQVRVLRTVEKMLNLLVSR